MANPHNLLVLSDVHLGSDLVQHARPYAPLRSKTSTKRDKELVALLDWYRARPRGDRPWRLVVAGDLIDFAGMSVPVEGDLETEPTAEELAHGLGSTADHTIAKLHRVAERHAEVFAAFARFVAAGNTLVVVRGNHDVDLHWPGVQEAFRSILAVHVETAREHIQFSDWFYYEEGVVYVEHGHQYDSYCSYEHLLHPVMPSDPRRTLRSVADVLLRYVVRPTRGMCEAGHDDKGMLDYIRFGFRLGARGLLGLARCFARACGHLLGLWREQASDAAAWMRQEHERRVTALATASKINVLKLRALLSLQRPPVTRNLFHLVAGVMLDRVALGVVGIGLLGWALVVTWTLTHGAVVLVGGGAIALAVWLFSRARGTVDPTEALRERAPRVAALFPAAFIVMGHTHMPEIRPPRGDGEGTYVNLGAWAEEDGPEEDAPPLPASRTHLIVHFESGAPTAELMAWEETGGPRRYEAP